MKIFKDNEDVESCSFDSKECENNEYAIYCVTVDTCYSSIKEYVNQCLWEVQDNAERDGKKFINYEFMVEAVVERVNRENVVVIFTDSDGYEWWDGESKFGRVWLTDDNHITEMVIECDVLGYSRNYGATPYVANLRPIASSALVPRADDSGEDDIPF